MKPALQNALVNQHFSSLDGLQQACVRHERLWNRLGYMTEPLQARRTVNELDYYVNPGEEEYYFDVDAIQGRSAQPSTTLQPSKEFMVCWNCKDMGHAYTECTIPPQHIFCYGCGEHNVLKPNCVKCKSGNRRAGYSVPGRLAPQMRSSQDPKQIQSLRSNLKPPTSQ